MEEQEFKFEDLPKVAGQILKEVRGLKVQLYDLQKGQTQQKKFDSHLTMSVKEAADYLRIPVNTLYMKLQSGEVPATKPGKRYVLYQDELDRWLEVNRKNPVPLTPEEQNAAILATHRRKPGGLKNSTLLTT